MADTTPHGIQATLFDYFQDTEYFDLQEAEEHVLQHQKRDVNRESIRARIYEGIDKGLFERVGKGLYTVTRKDEQGRENTCLLINGDGRDLSIFPDNSIDALITDHPYQLTSSLKGGNRNFANYELFKYDERDFQEKQRVLRPGHFLVEFLPEENGDNYQYLFQVKEMARKAGLSYYASVPWVKSGFVANTGRKAKNTENVVFFSKGRARDLRPDAKKNKAEPDVEHFMSGAAGMLPTVFDVAPPKNKIHQAEKPVELLEQILRFITKEDELVLDQFAGSGVLGEAALRSHRNSILIEKDEETFQKLTERLQVLGKIETVTPVQCDIISIGSDALVAKDAYNRTGDESIVTHFKDTHDIKNKELHDAHIDLHLDEAPGVSLSKEEKLVMAAAMDAIKYLDFKAESIKKAQEAENRPETALDSSNEEIPTPKVLECSSRGDKRFSALYAKVTINGKEKSIEEWYQDSKRTADGKKAGKGKPFDHIIDPFSGDKLPASEASWLYRGLWITYLSKNPDLVKYAEQFDEFHDMFAGKKVWNRQAEVIEAYVKGDRERYVAVVKASDWYQNMSSKKKKPSLSDRLRDAEEKKTEQQKAPVQQQMSLFNDSRSRRF